MNEVQTTYYTRRLNSAKAALAAGFTSVSAQKDAVDSVSRAYDQLKDVIHDAIDTKTHNELFWSTPDLHNWKAKHAAALVAAYPALAPICAMVEGLVALRATIKAAPVVKPESKKAATERKVAAIKEAVTAGVASPIALAIAPLRDEAVADAMTWATEDAARAKIVLTDSGFDIEVAAPPAPRKARKHEQAAASLYRLRLWAFLDVDKRTGKAGWSETGAQAYIARKMREAAEEFDSFVMKLDGKVGAHTTATLAQGRTWNYSVMHVTLADGTVQMWKTQRIVNTSVLGLRFNQWPTRIVK